MSRYELSSRAELDLSEIWYSTFKRWSASQADSYVHDIRKVVEDLAAGHRHGRPLDPQVGDWLRCPARSHAIFYRQTSNGIFVTRILHQAMDPGRHVTDK